MSAKKLLKEISKSAKEFLEKKPESLKIVCHRGPDGIIGASLLIKLCLKYKIDFCVSALKLLDYQSLMQLFIEPYNDYIFVGFGTESLKSIDEIFKKKNVLVFDHHTPKSTKSSKQVICPSSYGIKSYTEVSSSGLVYLFCVALDNSFEGLAWLPAVSVFGELGTNELSEINRAILKSAIKSGDVGVIKSLKSLALQNFPVHKALALSIEPYIPGISDNTEEAVDFLNSVGISLRKEGGQGYRALSELSEEESKRLSTSLIIERLGSSKEQEEVFGEVYVLTDPRFPVSDLYGFAMLLKACSYLNCPSIAISLCLKEFDVQEKSLGLLDEYVHEIVSALDWFYKERKMESSTEDNFVFFNSENTIKENTLSAVVSLIARSNVYRPGFIIVGCCHTIDGKLKVSSRVVEGEGRGVDLLDILKSIVKKVEDGSAGGHKNAAGAIVNSKFERQFEQAAFEILKKKSVEESVV
tara:strand:- start:189 stop:1595 length:1407 start_codon:yes stop_codon:yes gene_type:complete